VSRRGPRRSQTAFVEHSLSPGKMGERDETRRYPYPPGANPSNSVANVKARANETSKRMQYFHIRRVLY